MGLFNNTTDDDIKYNAIGTKAHKPSIVEVNNSLFSNKVDTNPHRRKFPNIVAKQEYWDSMVDKYGEGVKGRQDYMDMYTKRRPNVTSNMSAGNPLHYPSESNNIHPELNKISSQQQKLVWDDNYKKNYLKGYFGKDLGTSEEEIAEGKAVISAKLKQNSDNFYDNPSNNIKVEQDTSSWKTIINRNEVGNKALLYASLMDEGAINGVNPKGGYDGFTSFGLDRSAEDLDRFIDSGYLDKDIKSRVLPEAGMNEKFEEITSLNFSNLDDVVKFKEAYIKDGQKNVNTQAEALGIELTPEALDYFTIASYNYGKTGARKMLKAYSEADILNDNKFLNDDSYEGYRQIHRNIKRRLQTANMLVGEGVIKSNKAKSLFNNSMK